jgi:hypothetical protein
MARLLAGKKYWSRHRITREAGLPKNSLEKLHDTQFNPRVRTVEKINGVLDRAIAEGVLPAAEITSAHGPSANGSACARG